MNKGTLFLLFFVVFLGGGVAASVFLQGRTENIVLVPRTSPLVVLEDQQVLKETILVTLEIEGIEYQVSVALGSSAYDVMLQARKTSDLSFDGIEYPGIGFFVEGINGLYQDPRAGKYWIYYINGVSAKAGISVYIIKANDVISWKYEKEYE